MSCPIGYGKDVIQGGVSRITVSLSSDVCKEKKISLSPTGYNSWISASKKPCTRSLEKGDVIEGKVYTYKNDTIYYKAYRAVVFMKQNRTI